MDTFMARNELITALVARGFTEGKQEATGWNYQHKGDGFFLRFSCRGRFTLDCPSGMRVMGVAKSPADILNTIDEEAAKI